jgi:hypothetical protein
MKELAALTEQYHIVFPNKVKTAAEYKRIGPVISRQRKRVQRIEKAVELLEDPAIKQYAKQLYDKWLQKDKLAQLGVPEITLQKLEEDVRADTGKELEKVRGRLKFYEDIQESPEYEEVPIERKGVKRKPYRALAIALAQELGVSVPKSAKSVGKTWKQIYQKLQAQKKGIK